MDATVCAMPSGFLILLGEGLRKRVVDLVRLARVRFLAVLTVVSGVGWFGLRWAAREWPGQPEGADRAVGWLLDAREYAVEHGQGVGVVLGELPGDGVEHVALDAAAARGLVMVVVGVHGL